MHKLTFIGLILNTTLIFAKRFVKKLPDWLYQSGLLLGIAAMMIGMILSR